MIEEERRSEGKGNYNQTSRRCLQETWYVVAKKPYYTQELNLVLKNGKRLTVLSHADKVRIREDAKELAEFLDIAVWDAIDDDTTTYNELFRNLM